MTKIEFKRAKFMNAVPERKFIKIYRVKQLFQFKSSRAQSLWKIRSGRQRFKFYSKRKRFRSIVE